MKEIKIVSFDEWWDFIGSSFYIEDDEDIEEHSYRVAKKAWDYCLTLSTYYLNEELKTSSLALD